MLQAGKVAILLLINTFTLTVVPTYSICILLT
jgi:hypothetical protein